MKYLKIFFIAFIIIGCSQKDSTKFKPFDELNGMKISEHLSGQKAQQLIDELHGKAVSPNASDIIFYNNENTKAVLYVSLYENSDNANVDYEKMVNLIKDGNEVFGHFHEFEIDEQKLSMCLGMGQAHYFFSKDNKLFWLSTDYHSAQATVYDLITKLKNE